LAGQAFRAHSSTRIGHVGLNVSDLQRSTDFYRSVLGFKIEEKPGRKALLAAAGDEHLVELQEVKDGTESMQKRAGLYHLAILVPERRFLADMLENLNEKRDSVHFEGMADHLVSESIYIRDPDFNGIEIYCDRPRSEWVWEGSRVRMATERLDVGGLLREKTERGWNGMPARTMIGHMHLHVSNLEKASAFYSEILGLNLTSTFPGAHFFAAGGYHHHVATNVWLGKDVAQAAPEKVGLGHFSIELPASESENMKEHLAMHGFDESNLRDPDGIEIRLNFRS
jgi:catechol 2,3-dioxygenase